MTTPRLIASALLTSALILAFIRWPGITLTAFAVLASIAALVAGEWLREVRAASREHDEEQDLPDTPTQH